MAKAANLEYGHFLRWAALYRLVGTNVQNVRTAAQDEADGDAKLYARLASEAEARGDKTLAEHFNEVKVQEEKHHIEFEYAGEKALKSD
jgi:rubrerythrin